MRKQFAAAASAIKGNQVDSTVIAFSAPSAQVAEVMAKSLADEHFADGWSNVQTTLVAVPECQPTTAEAIAFKAIVQRMTGRTPRWCDVRDESDDLPPAPTAEAMDDCVALDANGDHAIIERWQDQRPMGRNVEAVCYF